MDTENPDGSVHIVPVMFRFDGGCVSIQTGATTRKARNFARCGHATVLLQDPRANGEAWVSGSDLRRSSTVSAHSRSAGTSGRAT